MISSRVKLFYAFTLVEMIIALVILTILASITTLSLQNGLDGAHLRSATDRVLSDLYLVRTAAQREQVPRTIIFTPDQCLYAAPEVTDPEKHQPLSINLNDYHVNQITLTGFAVNYEITFNAQGFTDTNPSIILHCGNRTTTIQVKNTGEIKQIN